MPALTLHRDPTGADGWTLVDARPPDLRRFVESIWYFDGRGPSWRERHFPTGTLDLIVHFVDESGPFKIVEGNPPGACPAASIGGLLVEPMVIEAPPGRSRVLGMRLTPAGAHALLGVPLCELTGRTVALTDIIGRAAHELVERSDAAEDGGCGVLASADWMRSRLRHAPHPDDSVAAAVREIERSRGGLRMSALRDRLGISKTRLTSSFRDHIGVSPKRFARIVRFRHATAALRAGDLRLSELALSSGYYDQAHMNAEFRALSGVAPLEFLAATRPNQESLAED